MGNYHIPYTLFFQCLGNEKHLHFVRSFQFLANYFANSLESGATVKIYPSLFDLAYCDENPIQHSEHWVMIHCD